MMLNSKQIAGYDWYSKSFAKKWKSQDKSANCPWNILMKNGLVFIDLRASRANSLAFCFIGPASKISQSRAFCAFQMAKHVVLQS